MTTTTDNMRAIVGPTSVDEDIDPEQDYKEISANIIVDTNTTTIQPTTPQPTRRIIGYVPGFEAIFLLLGVCGAAFVYQKTRKNKRIQISDWYKSAKGTSSERADNIRKRGKRGKRWLDELFE